jgi:hypothetical protein
VAIIEIYLHVIVTYLSTSLSRARESSLSTREREGRYDTIYLCNIQYTLTTLCDDFKSCVFFPHFFLQKKEEGNSFHTKYK